MTDGYSGIYTLSVSGENMKPKTTPVPIPKVVAEVMARRVPFTVEFNKGHHVTVWPKDEIQAEAWKHGFERKGLKVR